MRSLARAKTMKQAGLAACLTTAASFPQLRSWENPAGRPWLLLVVILWAAFFLWCFVFAWHEKESERKAFVLEIAPRLLVLASVCGVCGAFVLHFIVDPISQDLNLERPPGSLKAWVTATLFVLGFEKLFVCYAPFAFFIRLSHRWGISCLLTVLFGVFILGMKLSSAHLLTPSVPMAQLLLARISIDSLCLYFYLRGGVLLAWWWVLLLQARYLVG